MCAGCNGEGHVTGLYAMHYAVSEGSVCVCRV